MNFKIIVSNRIINFNMFKRQNSIQQIVKSDTKVEACSTFNMVVYVKFLQFFK